jgi:hypothetical protein
MVPEGRNEILINKADATAAVAVSAPVQHQANMSHHISTLAAGQAAPTPF